MFKILQFKEVRNVPHAICYKLLICEIYHAGGEIFINYGSESENNGATGNNFLNYTFESVC